ncbi:hypothetical protein OAH08_05415 [Verrucomicrobia bacterium]|nr:hypothetical protein [Verrucomicrobiota bacterium]MDB4777776.1 hypothetical protein [Verrucomicrobiota bacterium]
MDRSKDPKMDQASICFGQDAMLAHAGSMLLKVNSQSGLIFGCYEENRQENLLIA